MAAYFLAIDIGASSGRHILGSYEDGKIKFEEIYRFSNGLSEIKGHLCWNEQYLFQQILTGMKKCHELGKIPTSLGIDTWGVDFLLLNSEGETIGDFVSYRDSRTAHMPKYVENVISHQKLYERTGIQSQSYNTIYQLMALKENMPWILEEADSMLMTPDYFNYRLTGKKQQEYTMATTTQLLDITTGDWDWDLIRDLGLPEKIFQPVKRAGSLLGSLTKEIQEAVGYDCKVIMSASHDTASAVAAVPSLEEDTLYISSGTWSLMGVESTTAMNSEACMKAGLSNEGGYNSKYTVLKNIMGLWMIQSVKKEIGEDKSFGEICEMASKESITSIVDCNHDMFLAPKSMVAAIQEYCTSTEQEVPFTLASVAAVIYNSLAKYYATTKQQIEQLTQKKYDRIYIIGGGSQADYLNRLTSRYAECEICAGPTEATAIGNILIQMISCKELENLLEARKAVMRSFEPVIYIREA